MLKEISIISYMYGANDDSSEIVDVHYAIRCDLDEAPRLLARIAPEICTTRYKTDFSGVYPDLLAAQDSPKGTYILVGGGTRYNIMCVNEHPRKWWWTWAGPVKYFDEIGYITYVYTNIQIYDDSAKTTQVALGDVLEEISNIYAENDDAVELVECFNDPLEHCWKK